MSIVKYCTLKRMILVLVIQLFVCWQTSFAGNQPGDEVLKLLGRNLVVAHLMGAELPEMERNLAQCFRPHREWPHVVVQRLDLSDEEHNWPLFPIPRGSEILDRANGSIIKDDFQDKNYPLNSGRFKVEYDFYGHFIYAFHIRHQGKYLSCERWGDHLGILFCERYTWGATLTDRSTFYMRARAMWPTETQAKLLPSDPDKRWMVSSTNFGLRLGLFYQGCRINQR